MSESENRYPRYKEKSSETKDPSFEDRFYRFYTKDKARRLGLGIAGCGIMENLFRVSDGLSELNMEEKQKHCKEHWKSYSSDWLEVVCYLENRTLDHLKYYVKSKKTVYSSNDILWFSPVIKIVNKSKSDLIKGKIRKGLEGWEWELDEAQLIDKQVFTIKSLKELKNFRKLVLKNIEDRQELLDEVSKYIDVVIDCWEKIETIKKRIENQGKPLSF